MILPFLAFLLISFIGGAVNSILIRTVDSEIPPLTGAFLRFFGAFLLLLPFWFREKKLLKKDDLIKVIPFSINIALFSIAIQYTSVVMVNVIYALAPIVVAVFGFFLLKEKLLKEHIVGLIISLIGVGILIFGSFETQDILSFGTPLGNILIFIGVFFWSFWLLGSRSLSKTYTSFTILFSCFFVATMLLVFIIPFEWTIRPLSLSAISYKGLGSILGTILFSSIVVYFVYQWLIKHTSAFIGSLVQYGSVAFGALAGVIVYQERLTTQLIIGALLVVSGVFLATTYSQLQKRK